MSPHRDIVAASPSKPAGSAGRNVIAVIGIDRYRHWRALNNAVGDARGARSLFLRLGFEEVTPPLFDEAATGGAMQSLVSDDLMALDADDSLVLFYAGHGGTRTQQLGGKSIKTGYLIPVDAANTPSKVATWVELDGWLRRVATLPPKHILVILDACYSGIALSPIIKWGRDGGAPLPYGTLRARRSRLVITSALDDEIALDVGPVHGHSLFTGCLIQGLTGGLGGNVVENGRWMTTGSDIGRYLRQRVLQFPDHLRFGSRQTPDFGSFDFDDRGEMWIPVLAGEHFPDAAPDLTGRGLVGVREPSAHVVSPTALPPPEAPAPMLAQDPDPAGAGSPTPTAGPAEAVPGSASASAKDAALAPAPSLAARPSRNVLGISAATLRDSRSQWVVLPLVGIMLLTSGGAFLPFKLPELSLLIQMCWVYSGGAYLLMAIISADLRAKSRIPWLLALISMAMTQWSHLSTVTQSLYSEFHFNGDRTVWELYAPGYSVLLSGVLARMALGQAGAGRIRIGLGVACFIPSLVVDTMNLYSLLTCLPVLFILAFLLEFVMVTLGVSCAVFVLPLRSSARRSFETFAPRVVAALIWSSPLQWVLLVVAAIVHQRGPNVLAMLWNGLLPSLASTGVMMLVLPVTAKQPEQPEQQRPLAA